VQVFKNEHGCFGCPLNKLPGGLLGKGAGTVALLATKPFQNTSDTSCILVLCLTSRKLRLKTGAGFGSPSVLGFNRLATDEEFSAIMVYRNKGVGFVEVNTYGEDALRFWDFKSERDPSNQFAVALEHIQAINLFGLSEHRFEIFGDGIAKMLAPAHGPDRERSIFAKIRITPTTANQEEGAYFLEEKWARRKLVIGLGTLIGSSNSANSRDGHLGTQRPFDPMILPSLQCKGMKRLAAIEARYREGLLNRSERL